MNDWWVIPVLLLILAGIILMIWQAAHNRRTKEELEAQGVHADHYWALLGNYVALDITRKKIAIKGKLPREDRSGAGIYTYDQLKHVEHVFPPPPGDSYCISMLFLTSIRLSEAKYYIVALEDMNQVQNLLDTMRSEQLPNSESMDMVINDL